MIYEIGRAGLSRMIRAFFDIKGETPINVEGQIVPYFNALEPPPELEILKGDLLGVGGVSMDAVAGQSGRATFTMPLQRVAIIDRLILKGLGDGIARVVIGVPCGGVVIAAQRSVRDDRWGSQEPTLSIVGGTAVALCPNGVGEIDFQLQNGIDREIVGPWVLSGRVPSATSVADVLNVGFDQVNTLFSVMAFWRERRLERGELA